MDEETAKEFLDLFNVLDGKIFALRYALQAMMERDPNPVGARDAIVAKLDGFIALSSEGTLSGRRRQGVKEIQASFAQAFDL